MRVTSSFYKGGAEARGSSNPERRARPSGPTGPRGGGGGRAYSQHHEAGEVLEGEVGDTANAVEGQGHGLQGRQVVQGPDRDLGECIVVQPQVAEAGQPLEAPLRDQ